MSTKLCNISFIWNTYQLLSIYEGLWNIKRLYIIESYLRTISITIFGSKMSLRPLTFKSYRVSRMAKSDSIWITKCAIRNTFLPVWNGRSKKPSRTIITLISRQLEWNMPKKNMHFSRSLDGAFAEKMALFC